MPRLFIAFAMALVLLASALAPPARAQSIVSDLEQEIRQRAAQIETKLIAWRRDIHEHPELGEQETRTAGVIAEHLTNDRHDTHLRRGRPDCRSPRHPTDRGEYRVKRKR